MRFFRTEVYENMIEKFRCYYLTAKDKVKKELLVKSLIGSL